MRENLIFVYGTLRKDEANSPLLRGADFCGRHRTTARYGMLNLGDYPGVIQGGNTAISGEVYRVNPQQLRQLDRLEQYPTLYTRKQIPTPWGEAWIYLYQGTRQGATVITTGDWCRRHG